MKKQFLLAFVLLLVSGSMFGQIVKSPSGITQRKPSSGIEKRSEPRRGDRTQTRPVKEEKRAEGFTATESGITVKK